VTPTSLIFSSPRDAVAPRGPVLAVSQAPASSVWGAPRPAGRGAAARRAGGGRAAGAAPDATARPLVAPEGAPGDRPVRRALGAHALLCGVAGIAAGRRRASALRHAAGALALLASVATLAIVAAGVGPAHAQETPVRGGRVLDSLISEPDSLDPARANLLVSQYVLGLLYDRLVYIDPSGRPRPWLAESWTVDKDGREVTFTIRKGVTFTDGTPVDAEAVRYSLERYLKLSKRNADLGPVQKIEVAGGGVRLTFGRPFAALFTALDSSYLGIVSRAAAEKAGEEFGRRPVGSGPYTLKEWRAGSTLLFARNAGYRNLRGDVENKGAPYPDEWQISIVKEEGTRMAALETGQLHMSWAPFEEVPRIEKDPRLQLIRRPKGVSYIFLEFNTRKPPFDRLALRKAIAYSVDPKEVLDASYLYGTVIQAPMPLGVPGFSAEAGRQHGYRRDEARAAALFKEAGYTRGGDGKLRDAAGRPLRITLTTWVAPQISRAAQVLQAELQAVGVECELTQTDAGAFLAKLPEGKHDFDLMRMTYADPNGLTRLVRSPGRWNHYGNPKLDALLDQADAAMDPDRRMALLREIQAIVLEDAAIVPLFSDDFMIAARREVRGYKFDGTGTPMYYDVWLRR
jgi:peptide/nickel transport system substrate-binding protein